MFDTISSLAQQVHRFSAAHATALDRLGEVETERNQLEWERNELVDARNTLARRIGILTQEEREISSQDVCTTAGLSGIEDAD